METMQQLSEFISLWNHLEGVELNDRPDCIRWIWTENGVYSSKSAYLAQFKGSYSSFKADSVWKAHAEGKQKFFAWLLIQAKILTADKLIKRNWPCNPVCVLCGQEPETALHLCIKCPFALEVWEKVRTWTNNLVTPPSPDTQSIELWWTSALQNKSKEDQRTIAGLLMYFTWNIWKERNRRIFEGKSAPALLVFQLTQDEMALRRAAIGHPCLP